MGKIMINRKFEALAKLQEGKSKEEIRAKWQKAVKEFYNNSTTNTYAVHLELPFDENGGTEYVIATVYNAMSSAEAVAAVVSNFNLPEIDVLNEEEEYYNSTFGIVKVVKKGKFRTFEHDEVLSIIDFVIANHYRQDVLEGGKQVIIDNGKELKLMVVRKFDL
jgi:hypothetical protein